MSHLVRFALRLGAPAALALVAGAQTLTSTVNLDSAQEVPAPPVPSAGTGMATVTVDAVKSDSRATSAMRFRGGAFINEAALSRRTRRTWVFSVSPVTP